jgi:hypothetical protein
VPLSAEKLAAARAAILSALIHPASPPRWRLPPHLLPQAAAALDGELCAVQQVAAQREAQLAEVTRLARRQSEGANAALADSQRQVERLEGLAVALRESLAPGAGGGGGVADLSEAARHELARRFQELRRQLESAQVGGPGARRCLNVPGTPLQFCLCMALAFAACTAFTQHLLLRHPTTSLSPRPP